MMARLACVSLLCFAFLGSAAMAQNDLDQDPLGQYLLLQNFQIIGQGVGNLVGDLAQLSAVKAKATADIEQARSDFWKQYPNGPDVRPAAQKFFSLLRQKDLYYAYLDSMYAVTGSPNSESARSNMGAQIIFGRGTGEIDGGIRQGAIHEYNEWTDELHTVMVQRMKQSDSSLAGISQLVTAFPYALEKTQKEYLEYVKARDWAEMSLVHRKPAGITSTPLYVESLIMHNLDFTRPESETAYQTMVEAFGKEHVDHAGRVLREAPKADNGGLLNPSALGLFVAVESEEERHEGARHGVKRPAPPGMSVVMDQNLYRALIALLGRADGRSYLIALIYEALDRSTLYSIPGLRSEPKPDQWRQCVAIYNRLGLAYGEPAVRAEADRILRATKASGTNWVLDDQNRPLDTPFGLFQSEIARKDPKGFVRSILLFTKIADEPKALDSAYNQLVQSNGETHLLQVAQQLIDNDYVGVVLYANGAHTRLMNGLSGNAPSSSAKKTGPPPENGTATESVSLSTNITPQPGTNVTVNPGNHTQANLQTAGQPPVPQPTGQTRTVIAPDTTPEVQNPQASQPPQNLAGIFAGRFHCGFEWFDLQLTVTEAAPGTLTAVFDYTPLSPPTGQHFVFALAGSEDPSSHRFQLNPTQWQTGHPPQYQMVAMSGTQDPLSRQLSGKFSLPACGTFHLSSSGPQPNAVQRPTAEGVKR